LPNPVQTMATWRAEARSLGIGELFLARVEAMGNASDPRSLGFDASIEFQPRLAVPHLAWRVAHRFLRSRLALVRRRVVSHDKHIRFALAEPEPDYPRVRCVFPSWDNTARRATDATIVKGSTPQLFEEWVGRVLAASAPAEGPTVLFINGWNEWGEGCHLEPCSRWGRGYLEALQRALITFESGRNQASGEQLTSELA
jgi:hypothetical protein